MANIDDYQAKQDVTQSVPDEKVQTPAIPADVFLQAAENLCKWSLDGARALSAVAITDGSGHADLIQDLNDIAVLGRENPDPLTSIGFDLTQLDLAATRADELAICWPKQTATKPIPPTQKPFATRLTPT
ncbi:hypothetical protein [Mariniphaga sediminis]|uniref:hypothetical protein n=1 Tax=Mariniphaga sediminis TaxID=1628158 RepID=UPI003569A833